MKYDVFISYSRKDYVDEDKKVMPGNIVSKIKEIFDNNKISYWFDEDGIYSGDAFAPVIARNIRDAKIFLFISSENSNASEWTSNEIATAHAYKKKIIPFRYDDSSYNDSVIMYIARLDYIEHKANPSKSLSRLLSSVQAYLNEEADREQQNTFHNQEQERIVSEIQFHIKSLNNEIERVKLDREKLLQETEQVTNINQRNSLKSLIIQDDKTKEAKVTNKGTAYVHILCYFILAIIIIGAGIWIDGLESKVYVLDYNLSEEESKNKQLNSANAELKETLEAASNHTPFIVEEVEVKNEADKWGDRIISKESTYLYPRMKYIGLKEGTYEIGIKFYDQNGLSVGKTSPKGYSYFYTISIRNGINNLEEISGWGNKTKGHWAAGKYRIEIWYDGKKLAQKSFQVY